MSSHEQTDADWHWLLSENEWVIAHDENSPVISARRAVQLLVELLGADQLADLAQAEAERG